jgi:hypothetical protein
VSKRVRSEGQIASEKARVSREVRIRANPSWDIWINRIAVHAFETAGGGLWFGKRALIRARRLGHESLSAQARLYNRTKAILFGSADTYSLKKFVGEWEGKTYLVMLL